MMPSMVSQKVLKDCSIKCLDRTGCSEDPDMHLIPTFCKKSLWDMFHQTRRGNQEKDDTGSRESNRKAS